VSTNNLDLSIFQYDYDQSFAVFLLNADGTIYGRFGTRSHRKEWVGDVSVDGMAKALRGALDLHKAYPANKDELAPKRGPEPAAARPNLPAAAWLHDIGYSPAIRRTGFHPLDGALHLRRKHWDPRVVALVAHHSGARFVPVERGFADLMGTFEFEDSPVSDALTYADQTVGPGGRRMTVEYRIAEAIARHGPDSPNARARVDRVPYLLAVAERVEARLSAK
jgi:hypothetical protein